MARYGMVIDLKRCYGCYGCVTACKGTNHTPPNVFWSRLLKGESGKYPNAIRQALPILCFHCEDPGCVKVCPTGATFADEDGVVVVDKDICVGCKYCLMGCPYGARYTVEDYESYFPDGLPMTDLEKHAKATFEERSGIGVATKCEFCGPRRKEGLEPKCTETCPANARIFGDLDDPTSEITILVRQSRGFVLKPEQGTEPKVYYLPPR